MRYFLKCCGFQELGSVGPDGKPKRGRYLLSSMSDEVVNLLPPLSIEIPNDTALLPIVPLYSGIKTYANYVYHNSKYTGTTAKNPRNEYRIYLNNEIENHQLLFKAEDIVVIRKSTVPIVDNKGEEQFVYYLDLVNDHSSSLYFTLNRIIEDYPIRGGYGIYDGELEFFEKQVEELESHKKTTDIHIDKAVTDRIRKSNAELQANIFNTSTFRDFVLAGYGNACAITGKVSEGISGNGIDVVYIMPVNAGGSCMPNNGIALTPELSVAFIKGKFTLSDQFEVIVHSEVNDAELQQYHLRQIRVPPNSFFQPDRASITYHRDHVFGRFLTQG